EEPQPAERDERVVADLHHVARLRCQSTATARASALTASTSRGPWRPGTIAHHEPVTWPCQCTMPAGIGGGGSVIGGMSATVSAGFGTLLTAGPPIRSGPGSPALARRPGPLCVARHICRS